MSGPESARNATADDLHHLPTSPIMGAVTVERRFLLRPRQTSQRRTVNTQDILICRHPYRLTVGDVRRLLKRKDSESRRKLAGLIHHRLIDRYVTPLEHIPNKPKDYRSGFLTMAACCLMIETFQCFRDGKRDTKGRGVGRAAFERFFSDHSCQFPGIDGGDFYENIRCGILHQAQTHGHFLVLRSGSVYDREKKSLNATKFLKRLKTIVRRYIADLRGQKMDSVSWAKALQKIDYICQAIEGK